MWDVVVVGGGPAGLSAAHAAASRGARTLVLERATHPRYKTCGGGLIGVSLRSLPDGFSVPARDVVHRATFTLNGRGRFTRRSSAPLITMVQRDELDAALCAAARAAGATVREATVVRSVTQEADTVRVRLTAGGARGEEEVRARVVIGADGSAGITARHVGVTYEQVDLGLEVDVPTPTGADWSGRLLIDWGPLPGSYGWVFPKGDLLTVGVIAARGQGEATRAYLASFLHRLGLSAVERVHDSGHLTRCRAPGSPVRRGRVLVAGDAAGLLDPWTREGISFALRSGALAGAAAASGDLARYESTVESTLAPVMAAGRRLLRLFEAHPGACHAAVGTPPGWRLFSAVCRGELDLAEVVRRRSVRAALALLGR
ncbi:MAG: geranylgeranyl reductase family protein [Micromonosporaceae bacterium]|nr:geranylgeranyl reductase family protein [Micromonosporaceae bacterium]